METVKRETLSIRVKPEVRGLIDRAAALNGKTRTDFMLDAARTAAEEALLDRTLFVADPKAHAAFLARLDAAPQPNKRLRRSLRTRALGEIDRAVVPLNLCDRWLRRRAKTNKISGTSRTYVACEGERVIGYYALASGAIAVDSAPGRFRRNMPEPIPVAVLARVAGWPMQRIPLASAELRCMRFLKMRRGLLGAGA